MIKTNIGDKYYCILENDTLDIIRIMKFKNSETFICTRNNEQIKVSKKELEGYTKLKPDGFITFNIVILENNIKDVIISFHRRKDMDAGVNIPYAVCRQNIFDLFSNIVKTDETIYVGTSISVDTVPEDVPYNMVLACNAVEHSEIISIYIDDTLENILELIPKRSKYDEILKILHDSLVGNNVQGYTTSVKQLLEENQFMYDFLKGFDIEKVPFEIKENDKHDYELEYNQIVYLEDLLKTEMFKTYVIKFSKEIDLKKIQRSHILISDKNDNLFIIGYDKGAYINRKYKKNIKDKRDAVALMKHVRGDKK